MVLSVGLLVFLEYFAVLPDVLPGGRVVLPDQPPVVEVLRLRPPGHCLGEGSEDLLHHGEVLPGVVGLEQGEAEVQLKNYTSYTPDITWLSAAQL